MADKPVRESSSGPGRLAPKEQPPRNLSGPMDRSGEARWKAGRPPTGGDLTDGDKIVRCNPDN